MAIIFDNDKITFSEWSLEEREETIEKVLGALGTSYAYDTFLDALRTRGEELGVDIENIDWEDIEPNDAVYDNAGESVSDALFEIAALCWWNNEDSWEDTLANTLEQFYCE